MGLISDGIEKVRAFELPTGVWANGEAVAGPRICLVRWQSAWADKIHQVYVGSRFAVATIDCEQRQILVQTPNCFDRAVRVKFSQLGRGRRILTLAKNCSRGKATAVV